MEEQNNPNLEQQLEQKETEQHTEEQTTEVNVQTPTKKPFSKIAIITITIVVAIIAVLIVLAGNNDGSITCESCGTSISENVKFCSSCGNAITSPSEDTNNGTCNHTYGAWKTTKAATCVDDGKQTRTCSKCNNSETKSLKSLGHNTSNGTCTRCGVSLSKWEKRYYTDEFNNPTSNAFIAPIDTLSGTFSNSATTNSRLSAYIRVDNEDCEIMLWEYGSNLVKASSTTDYDITILLANGTKKYFTGTMYKNGKVICFDNYSEILTLLKSTDGILKFYIKEDSEYGVNSTYLFEVNTSGFKDLYNKTF